LRGNDPASSPVGRIGAALDQSRGFQVIEKVGHDRSVNPKVLGQGKLATDSALSGGGKDLVPPRAAREVGHRGERGLGVRPQDHAQAPTEVACQGADAAGCVAKIVAKGRALIHGLIIAMKALFGRPSFVTMICFTYNCPMNRHEDTNGRGEVTESSHPGKPTVVVVGGGYGGYAVARALDATSNVVLVEPKDAFMHNIAALRALVDPSWLPRIFLPYGGLLSNGRVVRDRAVVVDPHRVVTASGEEISADYVVLATGSRYPFPAKTDLVDTHHAQEQVRQAHQALAQADRVLLVGAGPVGIELAGEIRHVWPEKSIVLLDVADEILGGPYKPELKAELRRQLIDAGVELILGSPLRQGPPTEPGELGTFTVTTEAGTDVVADIWFRCYGVVPNSDYLGDALLPARRADGFIEVGPTLQVAGQTSVFAIGDISTADSKMAAFAGSQAALAAENINALAQGRSDLAQYKSWGVGIAVPFGPNGGSGQFPGEEGIASSEIIAERKGREMGVDTLRGRFGLEVPAAP
jgi:NADH dehydrogenase FAD-containing subunit